MHTFKIVYSLVVDVGYFSNTIDHVGSLFKTPTLSKFISSWISLFVHSPKTHLLWKSQSRVCHNTVPLDGGVNVVKQIMLYFGDIQPFLDENKDIGAALQSKLLFYFQTLQTHSKLQVEIVATVDWDYDLEGDDPLGLECYERIDRILASVDMENIPNVRAIASFSSTSQAVGDLHKKLHERWDNILQTPVGNELEHPFTDL